MAVRRVGHTACSDNCYYRKCVTGMPRHANRNPKVPPWPRELNEIAICSLFVEFNGEIASPKTISLLPFWITLVH